MLATTMGIDCLAPRWKIVLNVFPKDTAMYYRIRIRTNVLQPFDYQPGTLPTEYKLWCKCVSYLIKQYKNKTKQYKYKYKTNV